MEMRLRSLSSLLGLCLGVAVAGCSQSDGRVGGPPDPKAVEVLLEHWKALQRGEWQAAYDRLHPDLKTSRFPPKAFAQIHARRRRSKGFPQDIKVTESKSVDDTVIVDFQMLLVPPGGGPPVASSAPCRVTLRKTADSWGLTTHDLLAARP